MTPRTHVSAPDDPHGLALKRLICLYLLLWIFEGALRKWLLPPLSSPLLIVRDPVAILIYAYALYTKRFPIHWIVLATTLLGGITFAAGCFNILYTGKSTLVVCLFGFRTNFLHLPLIVIMAREFNYRDVLRLGKWTLLIAVPMAALMLLQFKMPAGSWINAGAEEGVTQLASAVGKIRPPGTFTFVHGPMYLFTLVTAFLLYSQMEKKIYPVWLVMAAAAALASGIAVSGSRSLYAHVAIVSAMLPLCFLARPQAVFRYLKWSPLALAGLAVASFLPIFQAGVGNFLTRVGQASEIEGGLDGFLHRFFVDGFFGPIFNVIHFPLLGFGLGMGTNFGAVVLTGERTFLLDEEEFGRVLMESGALLGGAFLLLRIGIVLFIGWKAWQALKRTNTLPILLWAAMFLAVVNGQIGQPTSLGFAVISAGLCWAACKRDELASATHRF